VLAWQLLVQVQQQLRQRLLPKVQLLQLVQPLVLDELLEQVQGQVPNLRRRCRQVR
jgi:hypothetical protein